MRLRVDRFLFNFWGSHHFYYTIFLVILFNPPYNYTMKTLFRVLKWIFESISCALCVTLILHYAIKDESGANLLPKNVLVAVTVSLAVSVGIYAVFEYLYKKQKSKEENKRTDSEQDPRE